MRAVFTYLTQISFFLLSFGWISITMPKMWIGSVGMRLLLCHKTDTNPKKIFIDVYTDWCGWCKKMDKDTFQNPEVAAYMQDNFYMVKLDAEGKDPIDFKGKTFKFVPSGRRGYHEFAAALLQGKMSYPTVVFLDEKLNMLSPVPGYQKVKPFLQIARYFGDNIYKDKDWQTYAEK